MQSLLLHNLANRNDFHGPLKDTRIAQTGGEIDACNLQTEMAFQLGYDER